MDTRAAEGTLVAPSVLGPLMTLCCWWFGAFVDKPLLVLFGVGGLRPLVVDSAKDPCGWRRSSQPPGYKPAYGHHQEPAAILPLCGHTALWLFPMQSGPHHAVVDEDVAQPQAGLEFKLGRRHKEQ